MKSVQTIPGAQKYYDSKYFDNYFQTNEYGQKLNWLWNNNNKDKENDAHKSIESS